MCEGPPTTSLSHVTVGGKRLRRPGTDRGRRMGGQRAWRELPVREPTSVRPYGQRVHLMAAGPPRPCREPGRTGQWGGTGRDCGCGYWPLMRAAAPAGPAFALLVGLRGLHGARALPIGPWRSGHEWMRRAACRAPGVDPEWFTAPACRSPSTRPAQLGEAAYSKLGNAVLSRVRGCSRQRPCPASAPRRSGGSGPPAGDAGRRCRAPGR